LTHSSGNDDDELPAFVIHARKTLEPEPAIDHPVPNDRNREGARTLIPPGTQEVSENGCQTRRGHRDADSPSPQATSHGWTGAAQTQGSPVLVDRVPVRQAFDREGGSHCVTRHQKKEAWRVDRHGWSTHHTRDKWADPTANRQEGSGSHSYATATDPSRRASNRLRSPV